MTVEFLSLTPSPVALSPRSHSQLCVCQVICATCAALFSEIGGFPAAPTPAANLQSAIQTITIEAAIEIPLNTLSLSHLGPVHVHSITSVGVCRCAQAP